MDGHTHFNVTGMIGAPVNPLAENSQPSTERRVFACKARTGPDICQIENEIVDRISLILQRSRDGETLAGLEEGEQGAAPSRCSIFRDETELAPRVGGRIRDDRGEIVLQFGASATNERDSFALGRIEQRAAMRINDRGCLHFGKINARVDRIAAHHNVRGFPAGELGNQGNDELIEGRPGQGLERRSSSFAKLRRRH